MHKTRMQGSVKMIEEYQKLYSVSDERYTLAQLSEIFDVDLAQIKKWVKEGKLFYTTKLKILPLTKNTKISITNIIAFLHENQSYYDYLWEKHDRLIRGETTEEERTIRHILVVYMYYKSNGFLV